MAASSSSAMVGDEMKQGKATVATMLPWVEKYRPNTLDDIAHQDDVVKTLKRTIQTANLPHLLFYGPPGTGKTSTILAAAKELYGPELMKKRVLELNASSERGIDVVRNRVKDFAQTAVGTLDSVPGYPCPPYKIIILDEADSMTKDAQSALRRTMELYTKVTRFCIICNYVSRIIEPITSRCAKFRYKALSDEAMTARLQLIADSEHIKTTPETLKSLVDVSGGDMRRSITLMQAAQRLLSADEELSPETVVEVAGEVPGAFVEGLFKACSQRDFASVEKQAKESCYRGYPANSVLVQLQHLIVNSKDLSDLQKSLMSIQLAEAESKLVDGADEYLQLLNVLSFCQRQWKK